MKRVITGHDKSGKSVFVSVGEPQRVVDMGSGGELTELWATDEITNLPDHTVDPELTMESSNSRKTTKPSNHRDIPVAFS